MAKSNKVKIRYGDVIKYSLMNARNPASVQGSTALFRTVFAAGGPVFHKAVEKMWRNPEGARLLREKPDLSAIFEDQRAFGDYPEGTLGRAYFEFMSHPLALPGYLLGTQHYRQGYFAKATEGWSDDAQWLTERVVNTHDILHVLADYGPHVPGEALVGLFSAVAYIGPKAEKPARFVAWLMSFIPTNIGRKQWGEALQEAVTRAVSMVNKQPFENIYWEELMYVPMADLMKEIGLPPLKHPELNKNAESWMTSKFVVEKLATGFGTLTRDKIWLKKMANLVENAGCSAKKLWAAGEINREVLYRMFDEGASIEAIQQKLEEMVTSRGFGLPSYALPSYA